MTPDPHEAGPSEPAAEAPQATPAPRSRRDLKTWVDVAQVIGALAVVLSVLYAATQLRQSQKLSSSQVEERLYGRVLELNRLLIENRDLSVIHQLAGSGEALEAADSARFLAHEHIYYDSWETAWDAFHDGILDPAAWEGWEEWFVREARSRPLSGWTGNRQNFTGAFGEYVDGLLLEDGAG